MSHKNFLMWVFSTLDLGKTREFHECVLGFNGRRRGLTRRSHAGAGASSTRESGSKTACLQGPVVPQNLIRADGNAGELPGRANAVDFESGKRRRDGYTALFLSRSTRRQRDASLRERTQRTPDGFFDCLG
jgi:hypothetical protein